MIKKTSKRTKNKYVDYLGWLGVGLLLVANILLSSEILLGASYSYQLILLTGCLLVALEAWHKKDRQPVVLNVVFACIALYAIVRLVLLR